MDIEIKMPEVLPDYPTKCGLCLDTGVVVFEIPECMKGSKEDLTPYRLRADDIGHKGPGWYRFIERCPCRTQTVKYKRLREAEIPPSFSDASLDNARAGQHETAAKLKNYVKAVLGRQTAGRIFVMCGPSAIGKSYLMAAALKLILDNGGKGRFISSAHLCNELRKRAKSEVEMELWLKELKGGDGYLLCLDDVGAERLGATDGAVIGQVSEFLKSYDSHGGNLAITTNYENLESSLGGMFGETEGKRIAVRLSRHFYNGKTHAVE